MFYIEPTSQLGKQLAEIIAQEEQARLNAIRELIHEELQAFKKQLVDELGLHKKQATPGRVLKLHRDE